MKFANLLFAAALLAAPTAASAQTSRLFNDYKLVWADEFDGDALDERAWNIEVNGDGGGNWEMQFYKRDNVSVGVDPASGENCLILTAKKENYLGKPFTSGRISSQNKVYFKHGLMQARIKFPKTANGLWPAFWMLGNDISRNPWPRCGEIDIVEMGNATGIIQGTPETFFGGTLHWGTDASNENRRETDPSQYLDADYSLQDGEFHTYTIEWDEDYVTMYLDVDDYTVPRRAIYFSQSVEPTEDRMSAGYYFHKEFFILFNLAVGGSFTNIYDVDQVTALPDGEAKMYVDYVRVYQKEGEEHYTTPDNSNKPEEPEVVIPEDTKTQLGRFATPALDEDGVTTFDIEGADSIIIISASTGVREGFYGKIRADYSVDNEKNFLYIWDGTYSAMDRVGATNSFGYPEGFNDFFVVNAAWSGLGFASTSGNGKDLSMLDDDYWFHFAMRGEDYQQHASHQVWMGNAHFIIGQPDGTLPVLGDFKRDGKWYNFDIPVKALRQLAPTLFSESDGGATNYAGNVFATLSGGGIGKEICFDNIFFYKNPDKVVPALTDTATALSEYATKSLVDGRSTFDFAAGENYLPIHVSEGVKAQMATSLLADYNLDTSYNEFYNWGDTYKMTSEDGQNSFGEDATNLRYSVGTAGWSGMGYASIGAENKDLSAIDDTYYLHFALRSDFGIAHTPFTINVGNAKFAVGTAASGYSVGDFPRDGEWYSFDIPVRLLQQLAAPVFPEDGDNGTLASYRGYVFTLSAGGNAGNDFYFDNVFFYKKKAVEPLPADYLGAFTSRSLDEAGEPTFDLAKYGDFITLAVGGDELYEMDERILGNYNVDDQKHFLYIWDGTYSAGEESGSVPNSFGNNEGWLDMVVGNSGWSGMGYASSSGNGKDFSALDSTFVLHFAMRGTEAGDHIIGVGKASFTIGAAPRKDGDNFIPRLGNYARDGKWYSFDIPFTELQRLAPTVFPGAGVYEDNAFTINSGAVSGTEVQIDNIFFYRPIEKSGVETITNNQEPITVAPAVYDLQGRRVAGAAKSGLYILNGKKVLVK